MLRGSSQNIVQKKGVTRCYIIYSALQCFVFFHRFMHRFWGMHHIQTIVIWPLMHWHTRWYACPWRNRRRSLQQALGNICKGIIRQCRTCVLYFQHRFVRNSQNDAEVNYRVWLDDSVIDDEQWTVIMADIDYATLRARVDQNAPLTPSEIQVYIV